VREALRQVLNEVAARSKDVIAVLPDAAARVMLLDFDTLPPNAREADGVVRFRLKKSLPFDVEQPRFRMFRSQRRRRACAWWCRGYDKVLEEYERLFATAGYIPGVVVPFDDRGDGSSAGLQAHTLS